ncbi:MATE family efflux transporter [Microvirga massiliensis]|uniref:MATE family efflux transporter n=1 Tax=Microvirga massiliensis TaxID=1033741 RepID=UPI00062BC99C|nr:MATE family efflux transporter [Microvirga massiliensis]
MDQRTRRLLEGPIGPTLLRLALPNMLVMFVQASIGLIETYFVAALGTDALAGMALVFPPLMLIQMISAGAMGGGILSAVARAIGSGRRDLAGILIWQAVFIACALGVVTCGVFLAAGGALYAGMGGREGSLSAALTYSNTIFAGAIFIWLFNSLAAAIRGAGNMLLPAVVMCAGAIVLVPLSPALIFGLGPFSPLGIAGGGVAVVAYYGVGTLVFAHHLWSGRSVAKPPLSPPALSVTVLVGILKVGGLSSVVSATTNITIGSATSFIGVFGPAAVAGYGTGARLEYLLVPLTFGLGAPLGVMVGTCMGAGKRDRALRAAWIGAAVAGLTTGTIGLAAALRPETWLALFSSDPALIATGSRYLQIVGPFYGFFGTGMALYFAAQGAARVIWPLMAGLLRIAVSVGGGWLALHWGGGTDGVYLALGLGLAVVGLVNGAAVVLGSWSSAQEPLISIRPQEVAR